MIKLENNVKNTYHKLFKTDDIYKDIENDITFKDVFKRMHKHEDFYEIIGVSDGLARERIFDILTNIFYSMGFNVSYDDFYELWLNETPINLNERLWNNGNY